MSTRYAVTRTIDAPADRIWALLTDAPAYPEWNPAVLGIEGTIALGEKLALRSIANPKRTFKLRVTEMEAPQRMVWSGGMPLGLFQGVRTYSLTPTGGGTEFTMVEEYSGLLEPMISKSIPDLTDSFEKFADGLKDTAERNG